MRNSFLRLLWWTLVLSALSYGIFLVFGNTLFASAAQPYEDVQIRETTIEDGVRRVSGILFVPRSCDEIALSVETNEREEHMLVFTTWQRPYIDCVQTLTPRAFRTTIFSTGQTGYGITLDGEELPVRVIRTEITS